MVIRYLQGFSSVGRASVSKTEGRGFESLSPCQALLAFSIYWLYWLSSGICKYLYNDEREKSDKHFQIYTTKQARSVQNCLANSQRNHHYYNNGFYNGGNSSNVLFDYRLNYIFFTKDYLEFKFLDL